MTPSLLGCCLIWKVLGCTQVCGPIPSTSECPQVLAPEREVRLDFRSNANILVPQLIPVAIHSVRGHLWKDRTGVRTVTAGTERQVGGLAWSPVPCSTLPQRVTGLSFLTSDAAPFREAGAARPSHSVPGQRRPRSAIPSRKKALFQTSSFRPISETPEMSEGE